MKMLVATSRTQGSAAGDYCWTVDGELVLGAPMQECHRADQCGCGRGFPGLASERATTTAAVVERHDFDRGLLAVAIRESLDRQGWLGGLDPDDIDEVVDDQVELIECITEAFPVGSVLGRHGTLVGIRDEAEV